MVLQCAVIRNVGPLCEHTNEDAFSFIDSSVDNVLL